MSEIPGSDPQSGDPQGFTPEQLDRTVLAIPLIRKLRQEQAERADKPDQAPKKYDVVIDINLEYSKDRQQTRSEAMELIERAIERHRGDGEDQDEDQAIQTAKSDRSQQYLFARLEGDVIKDVVEHNEPKRPIFRIWPDFEIGRA